MEMVITEVVWNAIHMDRFLETKIKIQIKEGKTQGK